jgi:hypothetical protein
VCVLLLLVVTIVAAMSGDLATDFAAGETCSVHICVSRLGAERADEAGKVMQIECLIG